MSVCAFNFLRNGEYSIFSFSVKTSLPVKNCDDKAEVLAVC